MTERLAFAIATWFGCGLAPKAPGTFGALGAIAIAVPLVVYAGWKPWMLAALAVLATAPGMWASDVAARSAAKKDPGFVVVDEVLGQWIALAGASSLHLRTWVAAFALFRIFDIWKPWPVRQFERLPGGVGIVADDLMAGVYAALVLYLAGRAGLIWALVTNGKAQR